MSFAYYRFFPGDYMRDTMHLGWLEDCAYRRLMDLYYMRGQAIRNDRQYIMRAVRAVEPEHQNAVDVVLSEYFVLQADGWHQKKCDEELTLQAKRSASARASVAVREMLRKNKEVISSNDDRTMIERLSNQNQNHRSSKEESKPYATRSPSAALAFDIPGWIDPATWRAFLDMRAKSLRAKATPHAQKLIIRELSKLRADGHEANAVLEQSIANAWRGVFPLKSKAASSSYDPFS